MSILGAIVFQTQFDVHFCSPVSSMPPPIADLELAAEEHLLRRQFVHRVLFTVALYFALIFASLLSISVVIDFKLNLVAIAPGPLLVPTLLTVLEYSLLVLGAKYCSLDLTVQTDLLQTGFILLIYLLLTLLAAFTAGLWYPEVAAIIKAGIVIVSPDIFLALLTFAELQRLHGAGSDQIPVGQHEEAIADQLVLLVIQYLLMLLTYLALVHSSTVLTAFQIN